MLIHLAKIWTTPTTLTKIRVEETTWKTIVWNSRNQSNIQILVRLLAADFVIIDGTDNPYGKIDVFDNDIIIFAPCPVANNAVHATAKEKWDRDAFFWFQTRWEFLCHNLLKERYMS